MYLSDFKDLVSSLAVVTTVLQFLSGVLVCKQYVVNRTTAEASPLPFICGVLSCCLWFLYGLVKQDNLIILVNMIGLTLMVAYTIVFYIFTFKKSTVLKQGLLTLAYVIIMVIYVTFEEDNDVLLVRLGIMSCSLTLITIAAPMSKLLHVLRVKSTECLPFPMILMSFFVSTFWFLYGMIEEDSYLLMTNFVGAVLAMSQLSLFVIYPNKPMSPSIGKSILA
ncbi:sugar transporter SWEET1 [Anticarsia gemmatalis]|uniref:sugar transporter SWEET1 n=1 Tax=Anticarsia gemmatalis TaxID=129554 RepID=UPI003F767647